MSKIDSWHEAMSFYTRIDSRLGGIALAYLATIQKIEEISRTQWMDEALDRYANKMRMKDVGGATFQFSEFLHENSIMALAKSIEDTSIELKRYVGFKFDSVKNHHNVIYRKELQMIRALSNVIKHNVSELKRDSSESAKFLVDECGMANGWTLDVFIHDWHDSFNIIEHIPKVYLALTSLVETSLGIRHPVLDLPYDEAFNKIYDFLIPEVVNIQRPNKSSKRAAVNGAPS